MDLAYAMAPAPQGSDGGPGTLILQLAPIILVLGIFFFLVIRPQQRERRRREEMLRNLKKGDRIVTTGGLIGTIVTVSPETVALKIADSVRVECVKSAVQGLRTEGKGNSESA